MNAEFDLGVPMADITCRYLRLFLERGVMEGKESDKMLCFLYRGHGGTRVTKYQFGDFSGAA